MEAIDIVMELVKLSINVHSAALNIFQEPLLEDCAETTLWTPFTQSYLMKKQIFLISRDILAPS